MVFFCSLTRILQIKTILTGILQIKTSPQINEAMAQSSHSSSLIMNFKRGTYSLKRVPRVLEVDCSGVYVHKDGPYQDEIKALEDMDWEGDRILTPKLKGNSCGDFTFLAGVIQTKHFDNREELNALYSKDYKQDDPVTVFERISLVDGLKLLSVDMSCNMDYYMTNRQEMENDLGRRVENLDINSKEFMGGLEAEVFYNQMIKIFGDDDDNDDDVVSTECNGHQKSLTFREFHLLYSDGNDKIATARRASRYVLLYFTTS